LRFHAKVGKHFAGVLHLRLRRLLRPPTARAPVVGHEEFLAERYFRTLDGLRALSILLVLTWHTNRSLLAALSGWEGPSVFFVISGFLITTLCLREERRDGAVSLSAFYVRRACRILPLYFVVLAFYVVVDIGLNRQGERHALLHALPYYLSYMNDFVPAVGNLETPFRLSWTLGVEEKFYLVWPLLAFVLLVGRARVRLIAAGLLVLAALPGLDSTDHYLPYGQIMVGCLVALCLQERWGFERIQAVVRHSWFVLAALAGVHVLMYRHPTIASALLGPAVGLAIAALVTTRPAWGKPLASRFLIYVGKRSYGVYLVNLICLSICVSVAHEVAPSIAFNAENQPAAPNAWLTTIVLFATLTCSSLIAAEFLHRTVEAPMIARGRAWSRLITHTRPVAPPRFASERDVAVEEADTAERDLEPALRSAQAAGQAAST
jgi:peptidoglycan/LPS O-acetylase OafA/YrhL